MSSSSPSDLAGTHVGLLGRGAGEWNAWRADNPRTRPVLRGARLDGADLRGFDLAFINGIGGGTDFRDASLRHAKLCGCDCRCADFSGADLGDADLSDADLGGTDLSGSVLRSANLSRTSIGDFVGADLKRATLVSTRAASVDGSYSDLTGADLTGATFSHVDLQHARFNDATIEGATFSDCRVFGTAAWGLRGSPAKQERLYVTPISADIRPPTGPDLRQREEQYDAALTVDIFELAPLVFAVLNRDRFSEVINTFTSKVVLILGRFTEPRMAVLQALRQQLAGLRYLPVVFDFASPWRRDLTETISTLAHLSRFVVADLTDAKSIPQELGRIVPFLPSVPVVPLIGGPDEEPYAMFEHFARYPWVQELVRYTDVDDLIGRIASGIVQPAEVFCGEDRA
ncbi:MAG TPA: pentapeptide repeat-containing protein [Longimicrobiales bacterium]|nr:pentapeptide repeat-containing protein [Longimicrobiales bacterium]